MIKDISKKERAVPGKGIAWKKAYWWVEESNSEGYQEGKQAWNEVDNRRNIWYPYGACTSTSVSSFVKLDFYVKIRIYG